MPTPRELKLTSLTVLKGREGLERADVRQAGKSGARALGRPQAAMSRGGIHDGHAGEHHRGARDLRVAHAVAQPQELDGGREWNDQQLADLRTRRWSTLASGSALETHHGTSDCGRTPQTPPLSAHLVEAHGVDHQRQVERGDADVGRKRKHDLVCAQLLTSVRPHHPSCCASASPPRCQCGSSPSTPAPRPSSPFQGTSLPLLLSPRHSMAVSSAAHDRKWNAHSVVAVRAAASGAGCAVRAPRARGQAARAGTQGGACTQAA